MLLQGHLCEKGWPFIMPVSSTYYDIYPESAWALADSLAIARSLTKGERDAIDDSDFAWPDAPDHPKYPIDSQAHLDAAARLIGRAPESEQAAIKARAIKIARRKGFALPDSWQAEENEKAGKGDTPHARELVGIAPPHPPMTGKHSHGHGHMDGYSHEHEHEHANDNDHDHTHMHAHHRAAAASHEPMTGTHTHSHPAFGSQGGDETHEHEHSHENDADHHHSHAEARTTAIQASDRTLMSMPLVRIDATKRMVWGQATAEVPDSYGTIFGYYPEAWKSWRGNIREQHDPKKAVGTRVELDCDDTARAIYVGSRISRGAPDTWLKVEDNVLTGYSACILPDAEFGSDPRRWPRKLYNGKEYPYLPRYTVAELSLVDNPATPGCNIQIVRADGFATDVLDLSEDEPQTTSPEQLARAGASISKVNSTKLHGAAANALHGVMDILETCGCPQCQAISKVLDPDQDGDIDLGGLDDPDGDAAGLYPATGNDAPVSRQIAAIVERVVTESMNTVYARLSAIAGTLARNTTSTPSDEFPAALTRAFDDILTARFAELPTKASLDEVRADLSAVKGQVDLIAKQPQPGGPIMNMRAIDKRLPTDQPAYAPKAPSLGAVYDTIAELSRRGDLDTQEKQIDAVTAGLLAQHGRI
jgi:hypothetical protein